MADVKTNEIIYDSASGKFRYFDNYGTELHDGDTVSIGGGEAQKLYLTDQGALGTDATNPAWIKNGRATECEFGIYPLEMSDMSDIVKIGGQ